MHYDIISAFIKSIRGSDPDGALYWLARMVEAGEDPAFIARRLVISAAEDIGLANPNALLLANAAFDAVMKIGWPEGRIPLAEATVYLATSPKSNSAYEEMCIRDRHCSADARCGCPSPRPAGTAAARNCPDRHVHTYNQMCIRDRPQISSRVTLLHCAVRTPDSTIRI